MLVCVVLLWGVLSLCNISRWECFKNGACTSNVITSFQQALWRCIAFKNLTLQRFNVSIAVCPFYHSDAAYEEISCDSVVQR